MEPFDSEKYQEYLTFLARLGLPRKLRSVWSVSDVVNETLMRAHRAWSSCRGDAMAWIRQILRNVIRDICRKEGARGEIISAVGSIDRSGGLIEGFPGSQTSPSEAIANMERSLRLTRALLKLPEEQFDAVCSRHVLQLPVARVAERMGRTRASVAGFLRRRLETLRQELKASAS